MAGRSEKIVIVGAGQAGATLAVALRVGGFDGAITLIGEEPIAPYQRPPLSKAYLLGDVNMDRLLLRPEAFYAEHRIALRTGTRAARIDRLQKSVTLSDGTALAYDRLVLATGAVPRRLPAASGGALRGVFTVRGIADVESMAPYFRKGARVLIVGGGYVGLETAAAAVICGLKVVLVEAANRILQRVAAAETAEFFRALHACHGVEFREGLGLARLEGTDGAVSSAEFADGTRLGVDFVILGIGVDPATQLAEEAGLALDNGICVDAFGRTSDPSISAAGDCASFSHRGRRLRLESVPNAVQHAEATAQVILGNATPYEARPWFWSDQYDVKLQIAGLNHGFDRAVVREGVRPGTQSVWYFKGPSLVAVDAMNEPRSYMTGRRWIEAGTSPDADLVGRHDIDLRTLAELPREPMRAAAI